MIKRMFNRDCATNVFFVTITIIVCVICFNADNGICEDKLTIRIGSQPVTLPELVTRLQGTLESTYSDKYNIEWIDFTHAGPGIEAIVAGEIDIFDGGVMPLIQGREKGRNYWAVGNSIANVTGLTVRKDANINKLSDLKGKTIAYPGRGSWQYAILLMCAEEGGFKIDDIKLYKARFPEMPILLKKKAVDGFVGVEPFLSLTVVEDNAKILFRPYERIQHYGKAMVSGFYITRPEFATEHQEALADVLKVFSETSTWIAKNPEEASKVYADVFKGKITQEVLSYSLKHGLVFLSDIVPQYNHWEQFIKLSNGYGITNIQNINAFVQDFIHPEFAKSIK